MTVNLQRPLLVGGVTLALGMGSIELLQYAVGDWSSYALLAAAIGGGLYWLRPKSPAPLNLPQLPQQVDATLVQRALAEAGQFLSELQAEAAEPEAIGAIDAAQMAQLQAQMAQAGTELHREVLRLSVIGGKGCGKTTLIQQLESGWAATNAMSAIAAPTIQEMPSFCGSTATGLQAEAAAMQQAIAADLILYIITADITASELQTVRQLASRKRTLLVFNKQDQYLPDERETLLARIRAQVQGVLALKDVVAIAAAPHPLKVRQHQPDGSVKEWLEEQPPDLAALTQRLEQIEQQERQQLILASSLHHAVDLKAQAKTVLNELRRARALPIVEQFQWIAAATAFASPMPTIDLIATAAISVQMVLDLGAIYRQKFSLQQAQKVATTLGSLMLKLGLVELSTQAISSFLKTNAVTYVAGGCAQGFSAAYLTRVAGLSLIEYFDTQEPNLTMTEASPLAIERFSQILQSVFQKNQQLTVLRAFVGQAIARFFPTVAAPVAPSVPLIAASSLPEAAFLAQNKVSMPQPVSQPAASLDSTALPPC